MTSMDTTPPPGYRGRHRPDLPPEVLDMLVKGYVAVRHGDTEAGRDWEARALRALVIERGWPGATAVEALRGGQSQARQLAAAQVRLFAQQLEGLGHVEEPTYGGSDAR